jgi:bifunctional non-homologous end joining protein LigD
LQHRMHVADREAAVRLAVGIPVTYVVFDLLRLSGHSLLRLPYHDRRELLEHLELAGPALQVAPAFHGSGREVWQASLEQGMEGVIAKRRDSIYEPGRRSAAWIKIKHVRDQEVVIGGWRPGAGRRSGQIGSLMMGVPVGGGLRYVGQVGTGFSDAALTALGRTLAGLTRLSSPFDAVLPNAVASGAHWVSPTLVGEVAYSEWTSDSVLRHPSWRGLRPDKSAADVSAADVT